MSIIISLTFFSEDSSINPSTNCYAGNMGKVLPEYLSKWTSEKVAKGE